MFPSLIDWNWKSLKFNKINMSFRSQTTLCSKVYKISMKFRSDHHMLLLNVLKKFLRVDTFSAHSLTSGKKYYQDQSSSGWSNKPPEKAAQPPFLPPTTNWGRSNFATQSTQGSSYSRRASVHSCPCCSGLFNTTMQITAHLYVGKMSLLGCPLYLAP